MAIKSWPTAAVLMTVVVVLGATVLAGPSLGLDAETLTGLLTGEGALGAIVVAWMRGIGHGPVDGGGALALVIVAAVLVSATGCGASALAIHADAAAITGRVAAEADVTIVRARAVELDAVLGRARTECPSGCPGRADYHRGQLAAVEARWAPVLACRGPVVEGLRAWIDGIALAATAATEELGLAHVLAEAARVVLLYDSMRACVASASDVELPELPAVVIAYARGAAQ